MFGVGVEVLEPVHAGKVMLPASRGLRSPVQLSAEVHRLIEADPSFDGRPVPVVVENTCNALAVLGIHEIRYADADVVVIGVFDERVGGGLVMDYQLRRGSSGQAMEVGHLTVEASPGYLPDLEESRVTDGSAARSSGAGVGFNGSCSCGHYGHIDALATPRRIEEEFGNGTLEEISWIDAADQRFERARDVFVRSGTALGRAVAHVSNIINPNKVVLYLPAPLGDPKPDTAAAAYLAAVRTETLQAFSAYDRSDYLMVRVFPTNLEDAARLSARAAAMCVLESFIEHALRLDGCTTVMRRPALGSQIGPP
jgi:predicted NBD/HSP70 family sugar kinase